MRLSTSETTASAVFLALAIVAAMVARFGQNIVPFSLLPFVSVLAGCILGPKMAVLSLSAYALMGLIGIPVFATAPFGGPAYVLKPSFGFIPGFIAGAWVSGLFFAALAKCRVSPVVAGMAASMAGMAAIYLVGLPYLWFSLNVIAGKAVSVPAVIKMGFIPFAVPDLIKAVASGVLAGNLVPRLDRALGARRA